MNFFLEYQNRRIYLGCLVAIAILFASSANASGDGYSQLMRNSTLESMNLDKALSQTKSINTKQAMDNSKILKKSKELEGVFLSTMIDPMFPSGKESNLFGGGTGSDIFRSMMIQQYGQVLANAGGVGLTKGIVKQLNRTQSGE